MNTSFPSTPGGSAEDRPLDEYRVLLFARLRESAGRDVVSLRLPSPTTLEALQAELARTHPELRELLDHCAWAVDSQYAGRGTPLRAENEIACIPPVSGG